LYLAFLSAADEGLAELFDELADFNK